MLDLVQDICRLYTVLRPYRDHSRRHKWRSWYHPRRIHLQGLLLSGSLAAPSHGTLWLVQNQSQTSFKRNILQNCKKSGRGVGLSMRCGDLAFQDFRVLLATTPGRVSGECAQRSSCRQGSRGSASASSGKRLKQRMPQPLSKKSGPLRIRWTPSRNAFSGNSARRKWERNEQAFFRSGGLKLRREGLIFRPKMLH